MNAARALAFASILAAAPAPALRADAAELFYKWQKGSTQRFTAKSDDTVKMTGMGMNLEQRYFTDSTFSLAIDKVRGDGTAEGTLSIESFTVTDASGKTIAGIEGLPSSALKNMIEVDRKGRFVFKEVVYLVVDEDGENLLVSGSVSPNSASASARAGGQEVNVWASFDPKTGQLSGGASVKEIEQKKKKKKVTVKQDAQKVDLVPRAFMELLRLPEGPVEGGDGKIEMTHPNLSASTKISAEILENAKSLVKIKTTFTSAAGAGAGDEDEGGEDAAPPMPGMAGMPGLEGMNLPGMPSAKAGAAQVGMTVTGHATVEMNPDQGTLERVTGAIQSETSAAGMMTMSNDSKLELARKR